jgi:hypothetical protein
VTTVPDSNVRLARRGVAGSARAAGRSALARLLLFVLDHVSKLDRRLLLLLVASPMSACIIPAGPEFQDPAGVPDSPPFLLAQSPEVGSTTTKDAPEFTVKPSDINVGDDLFILWLTEYPPFTSGSSFVSTPVVIPHSQDGTPLAKSESFRPTCYQVNRAVSTHQIMAAISDSPFLPDKLLATESGMQPIPLVWTWVKNCTAGSP